MDKKYSIENTTKVQREKIANEALGISLLDADMPSETVLQMVDEYIDGHKEIDEVLAMVIDKYRIVEQ